MPERRSNPPRLGADRGGSADRAGPDKARVLEALRAAVARDIAAVARITGDARDEATSSESRAENQYDTRATEASYLAAGQGRRLAELRALAGWLDRLDPAQDLDEVALGALVALRWGEADGVEWVLVGPEAGPTGVADGVEVKLISARSPTGAALVGDGSGGLRVGAVEEVERPTGPVEVEVLAVR